MRAAVPPAHCAKHGKAMIVTYEYDPKNPPPLTEDQIKMLDALEKMDDSKIDYSDIPEMTDEDWKRFKPARELREHRKHS